MGKLISIYCRSKQIIRKEGYMAFITAVVRKISLFWKCQDENLGSYIRGEYTYGKPKIFMYRNNQTVSIGKFCSIGINISIYGGGEHKYDTVSTYPLKTLLIHKNKENVDEISKGMVTIGNDVWIGDNAVILSGVKIGDGAVIGNSAIVARDVPPYAIVAGNPTELIKYRFQKDIIEKLLQISWWDWSESKILANIEYFYGDVREFIAKFHGEEIK